MTPRVALTLAALSALSQLPAQKEVTSPKEAFGRQVGADYFLASYTQLAEYWRKLAGESDRMQLQEIGETSYGQKMLLAVISSPKNLARIDELRTTSTRLCRAKGLTDSSARKLAQSGCSVVWIDAGMHATESVAAQNIIELAYRMCSRDDAEVRRILDNVVLLVCPANPDGMEMVARGYMATRNVGRLPVLYQRYIGHDNNRDYYACNQKETKAISSALYTTWCPQILYNHHQSAPRGTIIFTPPFRDPFNYNFDPIVVRGIQIVGAHMTNRFSWEGKPGAISATGASYSTWWNGGLRTTAYFHNIIGILTESFGSPTPTRVTQSLNRRLPYGDYPHPVPTQRWHARQTIEYLQTANFAILDYASRYREELLFNIYQMGRNSMRRGSSDHWTPTPKLMAEERRRYDAARGARGQTAEASSRGRGARRGRRGGGGPPVEYDSAFEDPSLRDARAYVLSADAADFTGAVRLVDALRDTGVDVHVAAAPIEVDGKRYPKGSFVVKCAQAFRPHIRDMFEPQWHPDDVGSGGEPVRPYDSAGWTLAMQLGAGFERTYADVAGALELITGATPRPVGEVAAGADGWLLAPQDMNAFRAVNRLLAKGERVFRVTEGEARGAFFIAKGTATDGRLRELGRELGLSFAGAAEAPNGRHELRPARIGLFDSYGGNMATGWSHWVLEQFDFPVRQVFGKRIMAGDLARDFDVLIFHSGLPSPRDSQRVQRALRRPRPSGTNAEAADRVIAAMPPFENWARLKDGLVRLDREKAPAILRRFVEGGGTILAVGSQATAAIAMFDLPIQEGTFKQVDGERRRTSSADFFIPGSLLGMQVAVDTGLGQGSPADIAGMYRRSPVFEPKQGADGVEVIARYATDDVLRSGWAIGEDYVAGKAAVLSATVGKGRVHLFGIDATYRGQPYTTFRLFFNGILDAGERAGAR